MEIREARREDIPRLLEIYNHYVEHTHVTFDAEPVNLEQRTAWFESFATEGPYRLFVASDRHTAEGGHAPDPGLCGYASSLEFRARSAYARSVETSIYLDPGHCGEGIGSALYARLLEALEEESCVHRAYSGVSLPNEASVAIHHRFGFKQVGTFSEVGFKFGRFWDVAWFERAV